LIFLSLQKPSRERLILYNEIDGLFGTKATINSTPGAIKTLLGKVIKFVSKT